LLDVGGHKIHAVIVGDGSPAVVMISGMGDFALDWTLVQPQIGKFARAVAYDRAGEAWSEGAAVSALRAHADDLHALLAAANVAPPYVLVGQSWGGAIARVYAAKHPADVAGMVLIDSTQADSLLWINGKVLRPRLVAADEWRALLKPPPPDAKPMPMRSRPPTKLGTPFDKLPPDMQRLRLWAMGRQTFQAVDFRAELQVLHDVAEAGAFPLGDRPLIVLTRGLPETDNETGWTVEQQEQDHKRLQATLARLSRNSRQMVVEKCGHHIQLDRPDAVVDAVRRVVAAVNEKRGLGAEKPPADRQAKLPKPTGEYGIGRSTLAWTDAARLETQSGKRDAKRELLIYLFYPVAKEAQGTRAEYFPHRKEVEGYDERFGKNFFRESYGESYQTIVSLRSHAVEDAPIVPGKQQFPVLIFSHGGGIPVLYYSAIIENLVSHGYVVAAVEHTFDGGTVVFPDGHIVTQAGRDQDAKRTKQEQAAFHAARHTVGSQDNSFVLDQLDKLNSSGLPGAPAGLRGRLDTKNVGALGHSLGGMISVVSGHDDKRFRICLNLDGGLDADQTYGKLNRPVVAMYGDNRKPQRPGEGREVFEKRTAARRRFVDRLKAEYVGAPKGSYFLLVDSPGLQPLQLLRLSKRPGSGAAWRATPEQWEHNQRIILDCTLAALDGVLYPERSRPVDALRTQVPEVLMEPIGKQE
jgi:pimeloyl-ACP methyl ester carboxylesterase